MRYSNIFNKGGATYLEVTGCSQPCGKCNNVVDMFPTQGKVFDRKAANQFIKSLKETHNLIIFGGDPLYIKNRHCLYNILIKLVNKMPDLKVTIYTPLNKNEVYNFFNNVNNLKVVKCYDKIP